MLGEHADQRPCVSDRVTISVVVEIMHAAYTVRAAKAGVHVCEAARQVVPVTRKLLALAVVVTSCVACEPAVPDERLALASAMGDNDMRISTAAVRKMVERYGGPGLREALTNSKDTVRAAAAHGLAFCAGAQNERALLNAASDQDEDVRNRVAYSLGQIGTSNSTRILGEMSNDASPSVRSSAVRAKAALDARLDGRPVAKRDEGFASPLLTRFLSTRSPVCARE